MLPGCFVLRPLPVELYALEFFLRSAIQIAVWNGANGYIFTAYCNREQTNKKLVDSIYVRQL